MSFCDFGHFHDNKVDKFFSPSEKMWKDFKLPTEAENVTSFYLKFNNIFTYLRVYVLSHIYLHWELIKT